MSETSTELDSAIDELYVSRRRQRLDYQIGFIVAVLAGALALGFAAEGKRAAGAVVMGALCVVCLTGSVITYRREQLELGKAIEELEQSSGTPAPDA